jgi:YqaJ-like viral recombinase domain
MEWGSSEEDKARDFYEQHFEVMTHPVGFVIHPEFDFSGASPDSLVGEGGGLEIKCFKTTNHLEILETKQIPEDCLPQLYWNMDCAEREWWDFMSFDSRIQDENMRAFVVRLCRDEKRIAEIRTEVSCFHEQVEEMIHKLGATALPFYEPAPEPTADEMRAALMNDLQELVP